MSSIVARLFRDQGRAHLRSYLSAFVLMALTAGATAAFAWTIRDVVDRVFISRDVSFLFQVSLVLVAISVVKGGATYGQQVILSRTSNAIIAGLQRRIFEKILSMRSEYFQARHSTEFIAQQAFVSQSAASALNLLVTVISRDGLTLLGLVGVMFLQDPLMSCVAVIFMPLAILGSRKLAGRVKKVILTEFGAFAGMMQAMQEVSQGIAVVKAYALESRMLARQNGMIGDLEQATNKLSVVGARSSPLMETVGGLSVALVVIYGGSQVIFGGRNAGSFFSFITALLLAYEPAKRLARVHVDLNAALLGVGILYRFLDDPSVEDEGPGRPPLAVHRGEIAIRNLGFSYSGAEPLFQSLDLTFAPGSVTALVGRSGAGKSTLLALLLRFRDPQHGSISIDGQEIGDVNLRSLRTSLAFVGQDAFLFSGSIRENIGMGRENASEDDIIAAAKAAHAHDFIQQLALGYETHCGENGVRLSGGQRQRIAIARAFLRDAPILLLDEPTSALDGESEAAIQDALARLRAGRTTVVIAHRLSTIRGADKICVLEGGRIVEQGDHETLLKQGGLYRSLIATGFN